jgi:peroxiredoxin
MNYQQPLVCPSVILKTRVGDDKILGGGCAIGGAWKDVITDELFKDKKVVLFSTSLTQFYFPPQHSSWLVVGYCDD